MLGLKISKMENVFGIKSLNVNCDNSKIIKRAVIYSNNGTFKTSFSRALYYLSNNKKDEIKDRISDIPANIDISIVDENGNETKDNFEGKFIVFSSELTRNQNFRISNYAKELQFLTTDKETKEELNRRIIVNMNKMKSYLEKSIKTSNLKLKETIDLLFNKDFETVGLVDLENCFKRILNTEIKDISKINLKNIYGKAYNAIDNDDFVSSAKSYIEIFERRLQQELFDEEFNDSNCMDFLKDIEENYFLNEFKGRGISLKGITYYDLNKVREIFENAISEVSKNPSVLAANKDLMKTMGTSVEARNLKKAIKENPYLINQLSLGREQIVLIALKNNCIELNNYLEEITSIINDYKKILVEAQEKNSQFEKAIALYLTRFKPNFEIIIKNKKESILGLEVPLLIFQHKNNDEKQLEEDEIRNILSSGEKTALNIISFLVNYEANKKLNPIIILDDVVETFDYSNRHAFIEYINDLYYANVPIIVLTHNYEFYRTICSRVSDLSRLCAYSQNGKVFVEKNSNILLKVENIFSINNKESLIFAIPYLREIKTMLGENTSVLDTCLHYKETTNKLTLNDIKSEFNNKGIRVNVDEDNNYLEELYKFANNYNIHDRFNIKTKTILAIACRIKLEQKIIKDDFSLINDIDKNQLRQLKEKLKNRLSSKTIELIDRVLIATPEFIHGNSFMYEPLIDIDGEYLFNLYKNVRDLNDDSVCK